jgi:hypothetical protein
VKGNSFDLQKSLWELDFVTCVPQLALTGFPTGSLGFWEIHDFTPTPTPTPTRFFPFHLFPFPFPFFVSFAF